MKSTATLSERFDEAKFLLELELLENKINWNLDLMDYDPDYMDEVLNHYRYNEFDLLDHDDYEWYGEND